ncbi:MAG: tRNA pseudouridine(38-40) synthase TruA [Deltaproteobacteria bacterium]|nr:tRNA pseudouridine(38-40) synthase TruA [Deltaproteobacteria bacterium]MBW2128056.1 tRNA pseudouridine(38-40) synthase TruA [Deltaproteobacteria bacterium]MBW2304076.1 tRNA pseudouridine(38-40) synthase TruA [Deltaproteobacteria bacterium]
MADPTETAMTEAKKNIRIVVAYDGSRYHGWQRQPRALSIQAVLEEAIHRITREPSTLIASGRTDAGVHALHQVCHFFTRSSISPESIRRGLNSLTPEDIHIKEAGYAPLNFHAQYSARSKTYEYRILNRPDPDPFLRFYVWHIPVRLDLREMERCLELIRGVNDFSAFRSSGGSPGDPIRNMIRAELHPPRGGIISLVFEANGFLRHMVRNIVGTLVDAGKGRIDRKEFKRIMASRDRRQAGIKAPPQGLYLKMVHYDVT